MLVVELDGAEEETLIRLLFNAIAVTLQLETVAFIEAILVHVQLPTFQFQYALVKNADVVVP